MGQAKHFEKPPKQKVNPKGKYNEKIWIKSSKRDFLPIDEINNAIYNNTDISGIYDSTNNMYVRTKPPKPGAGRKNRQYYTPTGGKRGRPKNNNNEQEQ